jgi:hypothetical protein
MPYFKRSAFLLLLLHSCASSPKEAVAYHYANVGDIEPEAGRDDLTFVTCDPNHIYQYYAANTSYEGEMPAIRRHFSTQLSYEGTAPEGDGYVTVRFVVNCKGKTGWFRLLEVNDKYERTRFDGALTKQLLRLTKDLNAWIPGRRDSVAVDTYYYLNFKIKQGKVTDIMP